MVGTTTCDAGVFNTIAVYFTRENIVFFSSLMTALSNDVIFNEESLRTQQINFELYVKGGMPALKINSKTFDNNFEKSPVVV